MPHVGEVQDRRVVAAHLEIIPAWVQGSDGKTECVDEGVGHRDRILILELAATDALGDIDDAERSTSGIVEEHDRAEMSRCLEGRGMASRLMAHRCQRIAPEVVIPQIADISKRQLVGLAVDRSALVAAKLWDAEAGERERGHPRQPPPPLLRERAALVAAEVADFVAAGVDDDNGDLAARLAQDGVGEDGLFNEMRRA